MTAAIPEYPITHIVRMHNSIKYVMVSSKYLIPTKQIVKLIKSKVYRFYIMEATPSKPSGVKVHVIVQKGKLATEHIQTGKTKVRGGLEDLPLAELK